MRRRTVRIVPCRIEDLSVGDIINRDPEGLRGWFKVAHISTLFNGEIQLADESQNESISGGLFDVVGVQLIEEVELDKKTGFVCSPEPIQLAAPIQPVPNQPSPVPIDAPITTEQVVEGLDVGSRAEPTSEAPTPDPATPDVKPESAPVIPEPESVEPESVQPDPAGLNFRSGSEVDLSKVATALDGLDVGAETYALSFEPEPTAVAPLSAPGGDPQSAARRSTDPASVSWERRSPDLPPVPMPEGAVPVYGDTLPDSPSYLNPVVVREPGAAPLPKRRSGRRA